MPRPRQPAPTGASPPAAARVTELEAMLAAQGEALSALRDELDRSERRIEAMKAIGRVLGSSLDRDHLLAELVARTTELLEADRSTLFLADAGRRELSSKVLEGGELREIRLAYGVGIAGWVAEHGLPQRVNDVASDPRFNAGFDRASGYRTRCMLVWPVRHPQHQGLLGVVQVLNKRRGDFQAADERLLEAIASAIGVALQVGALYRESVERSEALERARSDLALLLETERAIAGTPELADMLRVVLSSAMHAMGASAGALHALDDRGREVEVLAASRVEAVSTPRAVHEARRSPVGEVLRTGRAVQRARLDVADGASCVVAVPVEAEDGGVLGVLELRADRLPGALGERELATLAAVAAQAGRAIVKERRRREREQSERLADMGRMLSGVIHDLRTPMTLISGYGQLMAGCDDAGERAGHAARIERQLELMSAMSRDVLAFARGERTLLVRKVMLPRFVEEVRTHLERALEGSGVRLELELRHRGAARFDETRLFRVFHNVACNARDAMPGGGRLRITVLAEGGQLVTHFDDDGPGVLPEVRDRLFEPFATAGKVGGTGLGLAMVRQIAEEHGGSVTLAEAPLGGARFTVRLPLGL